MIKTHSWQSFMPGRLQWRMPLLAVAITAVGGILVFKFALPAWLAILGLSTLVGGSVYLMLRKPMQCLAQATHFTQELSGLRGKQLSGMLTCSEFSQLGAALNNASENLHKLDHSLNVAFTELQEQQYAFDQHAIISIVDCNGAVQFANDHLCEFTEYARDELIGRPFTLFSAEEDPIAFRQALWERLQNDEIWRGEMRIQKKNGAIGWVDASFVPIRAIDGTTRHYICIQSDVTERKNHEDALAANQKALELLAINMEQLIIERTAELSKSNEELVQANQAKSDFISIVSHELRTPLTSIKSFAEILDDEVEDADAKRCLRIINEEADRLNRLINDILDLQKIDAGRMVWRDEKVNLVDITRAAVESFGGAFQTKNLGLEFLPQDQNMLAVVDSDKIRQIIANLLSNAMKFTSQGKVEVNLCRIWDSNTNQPFLKVAVADTGPGLAQSQLKHIFEQFYQVENDAARKIQGTGLGLTICKQIIDHYGGRIWAESELGKGTTISFIVPDASNATKKLGEILVDLGYLTKDEINQALEQQRQVETQQQTNEALRSH